MSKIDVDQIRIVRSIAQQLAVLPLDDVNLLLYNANGVRELTTDEWYGDWSGRYEVTDDDVMAGPSLANRRTMPDSVGLVCVVHGWFRCVRRGKNVPAPSGPPGEVWLQTGYLIQDLP